MRAWSVKYASRRNMVENMRLDPAAPSAQVVASSHGSSECRAHARDTPIHPDLIDEQFLRHGHARP